MAAVMPWHHNYYPCLLPGSLIAPIGRWDRSTAALSLRGISEATVSMGLRQWPHPTLFRMERYGKLALGLDAWKSARKKGKDLLIEDRFAFLFFFFFVLGIPTKEEINLTSLLPVGSTEWKDRSGRNREENRARVPRDFCFRLPSRGNIYKRRCLLLVFSRDYRK